VRSLGIRLADREVLGAHEKFVATHITKVCAFFRE
jgi:hypothetical protein